jgi:uncharacterized protein
VIDLLRREERQMSEENVDIVREIYVQFNRGNVDAVLARLDEGVVWIEPGNGFAPAGTFAGPEAVRKRVFSQVPESFDEFQAEPDDFKDEGDHVIVTGRFRGKAKSGAGLDASFEHEFELKAAKVTRFENRPDPVAWATAWA